jgi:hypothetical protein
MSGEEDDDRGGGGLIACSSSFISRSRCVCVYVCVCGNQLRRTCEDRGSHCWCVTKWLILSGLQFVRHTNSSSFSASFSTFLPRSVYSAVRGSWTIGTGIEYCGNVPNGD